MALHSRCIDVNETYLYMYLYNVALTSMQRHDLSVSSGTFTTVEILTKRQRVQTNSFLSV